MKWSEIGGKEEVSIAKEVSRRAKKEEGRRKRGKERGNKQVKRGMIQKKKKKIRHIVLISFRRK